MDGAQGSDFEGLLDGLAAKSRTAAEAVVRRTYERIIALVRSKLGRRYRAKVDAEEVANSAMKSFFRRYTGDTLALTDWQDLWNLIAAIALNKLRNVVRRFDQGKRDVAREQTAEGIDVPGPADGPEAEVVVADLYERLTAGCAEQERRVLELSLQGYPVKDVVAEAGVSVRTVNRIRVAFRARLIEMRDQETR